MAGLRSCAAAGASDEAAASPAPIPTLAVRNSRFLMSMIGASFVYGWPSLRPAFASDKRAPLRAYRLGFALGCVFLTAVLSRIGAGANFPTDALSAVARAASPLTSACHASSRPLRFPLRVIFKVVGEIVTM